MARSIFCSPAFPQTITRSVDRLTCGWRTPPVGAECRTTDRGSQQKPASRVRSRVIVWVAHGRRSSSNSCFASDLNPEVTCKMQVSGHADEYALIYGSPLAGYRAPQDMVSPAARAALVLRHILADSIERQPTARRRAPSRRHSRRTSANSAPRCSPRSRCRFWPTRCWRGHNFSARRALSYLALFTTWCTTSMRCSHTRSRLWPTVSD